MEHALMRGVFWVIAQTEDELVEENILCFPVKCDNYGEIIEKIELNSKNGLSQNHKMTWSTLDKKTTKGMPYNYFPRGRVEVRKNKAIIFLNGNILHLANSIIKLFGLQVLNAVEIKHDGSSHYESHFD